MLGKIINILFFAFIALPALAIVQEGEINNLVDGVRQGFWRLEGKNGKVDEGYYVDGKKDGKWKSLSVNGNVRSIITYNAGKPQGEAIFYDESGKETEHGYWNVDHWEGSYIRYHVNGNKACEFTYDEKGRRKPVAVPDSNWVLDVDTVIIAIGNVSNPLIRMTSEELGLEFNQKGLIVCDEQGRTSLPTVFAGGDIVSGAATVILAMGQGRQAAAAINELLAKS